MLDAHMNFLFKLQRFKRLLALNKATVCGSFPPLSISTDSKSSHNYACNHVIFNFAYLIDFFIKSSK